MNSYAVDILLASLAAVESFGAGELHAEDAAELVETGVRYRPAHWRSRKLSNTEAKRFSVVARRLEVAGQVRRIAAMDEKTTHIQPTRAGITAAIAIAQSEGAKLNHEAIAKALADIPWLAHTQKRGRNRASIAA